MENIFLQSNRLVAADASGRIYFAPNSSTAKWKLKSLTYVPRATSTAHATDYATLRPYKDTGTPTALAASRGTDSGTGSTLTQGVSETVTLTATGTDLEITQTDPLYVAIDATPGAGVAVDVEVMVEFEVIRL